MSRVPTTKMYDPDLHNHQFYAICDALMLFNLLLKNAIIVICAYFNVSIHFFTVYHSS